MSYFKNWTPKENNYITELIIKVPVYFNHIHFVISTETIAQIMLGEDVEVSIWLACRTLFQMVTNTDSLPISLKKKTQFG